MGGHDPRANREGGKVTAAKWWQVVISLAYMGSELEELLERVGE